MRYCSVAEIAKMEYLGTQCEKLLRPRACIGGFSYRKDLEYCEEC